MDKERVALDALASQDHQSVLAIIYWLENCQTREELNLVLKTALIPLLGCNGAFYVLARAKRNLPQLLGSICTQQLCRLKWEYFLMTAMRTHVVKNLASVNSVAGVRRSDCVSYYQVNDCSTIMALFDAPKQSVTLYFCCLNSSIQHCNQRHIELLKLLRPSLLQTIQAILSREDSQRQQQIMDRRAGHTEPLAVVSDEGILVYKNSVYDRTVAKRNCSFLSTIFSQTNIIKLRKTESYCLLSQLGRRLYEITLMLANEGINGSERLYLLRFLRITNKTRKIINQLSRAGLTKRELEIATLIYQGTNTRDISEKINLSYHTVRNHIKSIYSKLGVSTRSELLVWVG